MRCSSPLRRRGQREAAAADRLTVEPGDEEANTARDEGVGAEAKAAVSRVERRRPFIRCVQQALHGVLMRNFLGNG